MFTVKRNVKRNQKIKKLFFSGKTEAEIGRLFKLSRQRVHQIVTGYTSPSSQLINPLEHKILTPQKRKALGFSIENLSDLKSSRDKVRELVRIRDNRKCRKCHKVWKKGMRRFDVHHLDENMDGKSRFKDIHKYDLNNLDKLITLCHKCHMGLDETVYKMRNRLSPVCK